MNTSFAPNAFCGPNCSPFCIPGTDCFTGYQPWNTPYAWNTPGYGVNTQNWNQFGINNGYGISNGFGINNGSYGFNNGFSFPHGHNPFSTVPFGINPSYPYGSQPGFNQLGGYPSGWNNWGWNTTGNWNIGNQPIPSFPWSTPFNWTMPYGYGLGTNWGMPFGMMPGWATNTQNTQNTKGSKKTEGEGVVNNAVYPYPFGFAGFTPFGFFNTPFCNSCEPVTRNAA